MKSKHAPCISLKRGLILTNRCIVCDSAKAVCMYPAILKCENCGYIYADLDMTQREFEDLYNTGYFTGEEYSDYINDKGVTQRNFINRLTTLMQFVDPMKHDSLVEVGSAYGFFLELAKQKFRHGSGVDITVDGVSHSKDVLGLNTHLIDLEQWDFEKRCFDVACMWDTIEHLRRPDIYLERIAEHMPKGGLLALTTGDIDSAVARFRKNKWRMIHPPTHAHYFSRNSISKLLDKYGFDVIHIEHCGFYRSVDNTAYNLLVLRSDLSWIYNFLKYTRITYINLFDIMFVIARRR